MVANLSAHKRGDDKWEFFSKIGKRMKIQSQLIDLVDEDTEAFNSIMHAYSLPKDTDEEKQMKLAHSKRNKNTIEVPFK